MKLISVNVGQEQALPKVKPSGKTGIYKLPTLEPIQVTTHGLPGDCICDTQNHGGPDQAIYIYGKPDYDWWSNELGTELLPGTFGENLTISGLHSADFSIGDRLSLGSVILEVTAPRIPCGTLAARMADPKFVKRYRQAERPGLYCRIIQTGTLQAGEAVTVEHFTGETVSVIEMFRDFYDPNQTAAKIQRFLKAPIAIRARKDKEAQLSKILAQSE